MKIRRNRLHRFKSQPPPQMIEFPVIFYIIQSDLKTQRYFIATSLSHKTFNLLPTSRIIPDFNDIPWRSLLLSRKETSDHVIPLLELHLVTGFMCCGRVGWILYTSVSDTSKSPFSVPFERCATRNSRSNGM